MSTAETTTDRRASTAAPIHDLLAERWSPRAFDAATIDDAAMLSLLEAARWAPSASNHQPVRLIAARRGETGFDRILASLVPFNAGWAQQAGALVVAVAVAHDDAGAPHRWAEYDAGQAIAHLTVQAQALGLAVHQMGGIDVEGIRAQFSLPEGWTPITVSAIGVPGDPATLGDRLRERETAARSRRPLEDLLINAD